MKKLKLRLEVSRVKYWMFTYLKENDNNNNQDTVKISVL